MTLEALRKALKDKTAALTDLETKALAETSTEVDLKALEDATAEIEALERKIKALEASETRRAAAAKPADKSVEDGDDELEPAQAKKDLKIEEKVGLIIGGMLKAKMEEGHHGPRQTLKAIEDMGYARFAKEFDGLKKKTLNSASASQGGVLVPESYVPEIIPLLYPTTSFLRGGPRRIEMPNGTYKQPKGATGSTAGYRGEGKAMAVSHPTMQEINMSAKLLAGVTTITDQLMRWSLPSAAQFAQQDLAMAMGITMDSAAYFGAGTAYTPLGLFNMSGIGSYAATGGTTPTVAQIESDCRKLELGMENVALPLMGLAWVMPPRVLKFLSDLRADSGTGNRLFPELQGDRPMFRRRPVLETTQFPINGGGGTDETTIALIAFGHVMYGDTLAMQFKITTDATIVNGSETINTWQQGVMGMAFEWEHDFGCRYVEAVQKLTAVRWGA